MTTAQISERDQIALRCRKLRIAESMADRAMTTRGETHQEYLIRLFDSEIESRRNARAAREMRHAGFPYPQSFDDFDSSEVTFPDGFSIKDCRNLTFIPECANVIMIGRTGTGKTMLSISMGMEACRNDIPVQFYRSASLVNMFSEYKAAGKLSELTEKLDKAKLLILDEFGYIPYDQTGSQLFYDYISSIYMKKPIILNTNKEFSKWPSVLYDKDMAAALIGRLTQRCHILVFNGRNRRISDDNEKK